MARYELTIKATYLPSWGIWHGVRELIQNAKDAEVQYNAPMEVTYAKRQRDGKETGAIVIVNKGAILPKEALLIGHTTKEGDERMIGRFGEGLKYGVMALLRCGVEVKIRNGSEVWVPSIERSEKFNADVLVFNVTTGHKQESRVQFEVVGVDPSDWKTISERLLFIRTYPNSIKVRGGSILTSPENKGQVFVKGMFVSQENTRFGYDFEDADIDRDRRMISDLHDKIGNLLANALHDGKLVTDIFDLMQSGSDEVSYVSGWRVSDIGSKHLADEFVRRNPGVIPVERDEQVKELEAYGKKARQVTWGMRTILERELGYVADVLAKLRKSEKVLYSVSELEQEERDNLRKIVAMVGRACYKLGEVVKDLDSVLIVDFHDDICIGTYDPSSSKIRLARKILKDRGKALYTLVHEVAHTHGGDGIRSHEESIGKIMETILNEVI